MRIGVCWKWVSAGDDDQGVVSAADHAALEVALRCADTPIIDSSTGTTVTVVTYGREPADAGLRVALSVGADRVVRIDGDPCADSVDVATAIAATLSDSDLVVCGDHSLDRGTGSVPAFVAALLDRPQALGLIGLAPSTEATGSWQATRRLDGGRRELLRITPPAVVSVEATVARLRRASLPAVRAAASAPIDVAAAPATDVPDTVTITPFRPRPRVVGAPHGDHALDRIEALLGADSDRRSGDAVTASPADAVTLIVRTLGEWGYLPADDTPTPT